MKEINESNFTSLKKGDLIVEIHCDDVTYWQYLMIHPNNDNYVLMIEGISKDAKKIYIPTLIDGGYFTDYTLKEVYQKQIEGLEKRISYLKLRINKEDKL